MEEALIRILTESAELTAIVPASNIEWGDVSQTTEFPYIILKLISHIRDYHMSGASAYSVSRVQIDIYARTYLQSKTAARAVSDAVSGYKFTPFQGLFIDSERDLTDLDVSGANRLYRVSVDVIVHHSS